jgi:hypothetical protein
MGARARPFTKKKQCAASGAPSPALLLRQPPLPRAPAHVLAHAQEVVDVERSAEALPHRDLVLPRGLWQAAVAVDVWRARVREGGAGGAAAGVGRRGRGSEGAGRAARRARVAAVDEKFTASVASPEKSISPPGASTRYTSRRQRSFSGDRLMTQLGKGWDEGVG